jgi:hypothetical protein
MSLFLKQLKTLVTTLSNVKDHKSFDIEVWHGEDGGLDCGYVACICGHQAVVPESPYFTVPKRVDDFTSIAQDIANQLYLACEKLTGDEFLAEAIIGGDGASRRYWARETEVFTDFELCHPHLMKKDPTIKEAIDFIQLVIRKVVDL